MRLSAILVTLAVLVPAAATQAQSLDSNIKAFNGTITEYDYDFATGTLSKPLPSPASAPAVIYDNTAGNGFFFTPGPGFKQMDWGTVTTAGHDGVTAFQIGYATDQMAPVSMNIWFTSGGAGTLGFGTQGTTIAAFGLSGLPGSVSGGVEAYLINVALGSFCFILPDGDVGYAYELMDTDTGPLLIGPPNEAGVDNAFDRYDLADAYIGTFWFGGSPFASFHMQLTGHESYVDFGAACAGNGGFSPQLTMSGCACSGGSITLDLTDGEGGAPFALAFDLGLGGPTLGNGCTIDVGWPSAYFIFLGTLPGAGPGGGAFNATTGVPLSPGVVFNMQALISDSTTGIITSNGVEVSIAP